MSKYFSPAEFQRCTPSCLITDMDPDFLEYLDAFREFVGIPLVLSCAYRSVAWEKSKGRTGNSAHTRGKAVDIVCNTSPASMRKAEDRRLHRKGSSYPWHYAQLP